MNCIIVHGCGSNSKDKANGHWMPWIKNKLDSNGIKTDLPIMPEHWSPNYEKYKKVFEKYEVNETTILIGHSCGCAFLVRWLGETKRNVKKLILVAPWKIPDNNDDARKNFYIYEIDKTIKSRVNDIIIFTSNDEEEDGKKSVKIFNKALGGKIINLKEHGHYTLGDMRTEQFPELLNELL